MARTEELGFERSRGGKTPFRTRKLERKKIQKKKKKEGGGLSGK